MTDPLEFDPNAAAAHDGIFGLPPRDGARFSLLGVPFEASCSYGQGSRNGPALIRDASMQVDLLDAQFGDVWRAGIQLAPLDSGPSDAIRQLDDEARARGDAEAIQRASEARSKLVEAWTEQELQGKRVPGILGGDHSAPLGAIRAAARAHGEISILHIDAHHDLRDAYGGVRESHASIMRNVLEDCDDALRALVQVGIRDFCQEEVDFARENADRVHVHYAHEMAARRFAGETFDACTEEILAPLGSRVWISFDVDGLDPSCCPGTGTPVPGGLRFEEACHVLVRLAESGRSVLGFDLCEVAGSEWDGNVGARLTYKLCGCCLQEEG